ncbi:hypothetical protein J421_4743 (plasmid) [Gemmatirosa kalamazoonensis]|uniref:Uncharacterized protein n=1 Tax=Gemmatirosa kalamazoonensis TaxID=861299 RepID=W0RRS6_9BACT|nr:hypothetical protein [Gemmatirosa kalamazoonensis]AHG92278.1 hypothetical protein J421_4743 [Gemmatirosa kalamazoonensis]
MSRFGDNIDVVGSGPPPKVAAFERDVSEQLRQLLMFETGRIVINAIWALFRQPSPRRVRIVPWTAQALNADADAVSLPDATPRGLQPLDGTGRPVVGPRGTGVGSDAVIRYSPLRWESDAGGWSYDTRRIWQTVTGHPPPAPGDDRGEVLLHELVHAYRDLLGVRHSRPMGLGYDTREELIAIAVANLYNVERTRPLRAGHNANSIPNYRASMGTPEFRHTLLGTMAEMPALTNALARVDVSENLFARYATPTLADLFFGTTY